MANLSTAAEPPRLDRDALVDLGGWTVLREARGLVEAGAVRSWKWEAPALQGEVGLGGQTFYPKLNLRSLTFAENRCGCTMGRKGQVCAHAVALCLQVDADAEAAAQAPAEDPAEAEGIAAELGPPSPQSLVLSVEKGLALELSIVLPPNLAAAAPRDAIAVKIDARVAGKPVLPEKIDRGRAYALGEAGQRLAAKVEELCDGRLHGFLQLDRKRLRELLAAVRGHPVVFWMKHPAAPIPWQEDKLPGVSEHLAEEPTSAPEARPAAPAKKAAPTRKQPSRARAHAEKIAARRAEGLTPAEVEGSLQFLAIRLPSREHPSYRELADLLKAEGFRLEPSNRRWWLRDRHKVLGFLAAHYDDLKERWGARFTDNFAAKTKDLGEISVEADTHEDRDGFVVDLRLAAGATPAEEIHRAVQQGRGYVESGGKVYLLAPGKLERLRAVQQALAASPVQPLVPQLKRRLSAAALGEAESALEEIAPHWQPPEAWQARTGALKNLSRLVPAPVPEALDGQLRTYQRLGVAWMDHLATQGLGGVLADEMGLGKTVQALALIAARRARGDNGPVLIVAPAGLVENWRREAARFVPERSVVVHHGNDRITDGKVLAKSDLVLTSYATLARDADLFAGTEFALIIADEAQHLKNRRTQRARAIRQLHAGARFILTGTPIENSLDDLRALFAFLLPGYLPDVPKGATGEERAWFDQRHRKLAAPYIMRRAKSVVAPELPAKIEQVVYCELPAAQATAYRRFAEEAEREYFQMEMAGASEGKLRFAALTQLLRLRQMSVDPALVRKDWDEAVPGKLAALQELLDEALDGGHRMLVFSQFATQLRRLEAVLAEQEIRCLRLDGQTPARDRQAMVEQFNNDADIPVFLISLQAGGTGLNLTGADMVVHYDPWWNPAVEAQATDRAHRIGQTRTVSVYKLIASNTVEERVIALQRQKAELLRDLLDESAQATAKIALDELKALLRTG